MSLTVARSEREQNVLTHASLIKMYIYLYGVTVSNICKFYQLVCLHNKHPLGYLLPSLKFLRKKISKWGEITNTNWWFHIKLGFYTSKPTNFSRLERLYGHMGAEKHPTVGSSGEY